MFSRDLCSLKKHPVLETVWQRRSLFFFFPKAVFFLSESVVGRGEHLRNSCGGEILV